MINVLQYQLLENSIGEEEEFKARQKAKTEIVTMLGTSSTEWGAVDGVGIIYDGDGAPRPDLRAYNEGYRDAPLSPLQPETLPVDDEYNPFPLLEPPRN